MKKIWYMLGFFLITFLIQVHSVNAQEMLKDDPQQGTSMSNKEVFEEQNEISLFSLDADPYTGLVYTHNHPNADKGVAYGIDVSYYNGSIDWKAVKNAGIQNVMVRVGYRGYGATGTLNEDPRFRENIEGALNAGLNVGVYIFSQAINRQEASDEADFIIERIRNYNITLPVVIDFEYANIGTETGGRLYNANLSVDQATNVCKAFCRIVEEEGYTAMVYANKYMLTDHLDASELSSRYKIWLANYTTSTSYSGYYDVWQYSSKGNVNGISGLVDCNFWYQESDTVYQGIDYAAVYNYAYYTSLYADIRAAFGDDRQDTLEHFVKYGMSEGRQGCADFNVTIYKDRYADLRQLFGNDLKKYVMHYIEFGKAEGRSGKAESTSTSISNVYNGVNYSAVFNFDYYTSHYADIKTEYGDDEYKALKHFVEFGMSEGRQGNEEFNVNYYRSHNGDLEKAYGDNLKSYYLHYLNHGKNEGRLGNNEEVVQVLNQDAAEKDKDLELPQNQEIYENLEIPEIVPENSQSQNEEELTISDEPVYENNTNNDATLDYNDSEVDEDEDTKSNAEESDGEIIKSGGDEFLPEESQQSDEVKPDTEGAGGEPAPSVMQMVR